MNTQIIFESIKAILLSNQDTLEIPIHQRSKFEGWLKIELASVLKHYSKSLEVERAFDNQNVDIADTHSLIELKTPNTSYQVKGVEDKTRPITNNINSIIEDIHKLRNIRSCESSIKKCFIAFVLFPLAKDSDYSFHIDRIESEKVRSKQCEEVDMGKYRVFIYVAEV